MSNLMRGVLVLGMLFFANPAAAVVVGTALCGRVVQADPGLIVAAGGLLTLGTAFRADVVTDDSLPDVSGNMCSTTLPGSCGDISADAGVVVVTGTVLSIDGSGTSSWTASGYVATFEFGGDGGGGPQANIDVTTTLEGSRSAGLHPGFADGPIAGSADTTVHLGGQDFTITAQLETIGTACTNAVPTLPIWGLPLLGLGMLGSAGWMIRKRA